MHCEFYQLSAGMRAVYSRAEHRFLELSLNGVPLADDALLSVGMQDYHFHNMEDSLDLPISEAEKNGKPRVISTSCRQVLEEYFTAHQHLDLHADDRLTVL